MKLMQIQKAAVELSVTVRTLERWASRSPESFKIHRVCAGGTRFVEMDRIEKAIVRGVLLLPLD